MHVFGTRRTRSCGIISDMYSVLTRLGHFEENEIIWAPAVGHPINFSVLAEPDLIDSRVVSLMKRMPISAANKILYGTMRPVNYLDAQDLVWSRDVDKKAFGILDQTNALPTVLMLMTGRRLENSSFVLDISDSMVAKETPASSLRRQH